MTRAGYRRHRRWVGPLVLAAICAAGVAGSFGQSSAATPSAAAEQARPAAHRHSIPLPDTKSGFSGVVGLATAARDSRAKVNVQVPATDAVAYLNPAYRTPATLVQPVPSYYLPRHPVAGCKYEESVLNADLYAVRIKQPNPNKDGVVTSIGTFPAAHVSALGFGAIPVTATLHTHQIKRGGKLVPITADTTSGFISASASGASCDPSWETGGPQSPPLGTVSRGQLDVRISDIRIDKQSVDVGADCHTVTPLQLNLFGSPGYIVYLGGDLIGKADNAVVHNRGSVYPVHPGSTNLTIPAFTGCVNPTTGEDYSRLVTAMVSGKNNTVAVHQSKAVLNGISNKHVSKCLKGQGCVRTPSFVNPPKPGMTVRRRHH